MPSMVYMMTNMEANNQVVAFSRDRNGMLTFLGTYPTGGKGTGPRGADGVDPLVSQGSLSLSRDGRFLFAVNAGSNSISSLILTDSGAPLLVDVAPSGGAQPNSLDVHGGLLYVSNAGSGASNSTSDVAGLFINRNGRLAGIPGSAHYLSTMNAHPACVAFAPDGSKIVVSELNTNRLSVFKVNRDGTVTGPIMNGSSGLGPFGSCFLSSGILLVAEAQTNALSSYSLDENGILHVISGSVPNGQMATCWVVATRDERFAYTANASSGTITTYGVGRGGELTAIGNTPSTPPGMAMGSPIDMGVSRDGRNLYVLNGNQGTVSVFRISGDGSLVGLQVAAWTYSPFFGSQGLAVL